MYKNSLECPCKRTIYATHCIFNGYHIIENLSNLYKLRGNRNIFIKVRVGSRQTGGQIDRQVDQSHKHFSTIVVEHGGEVKFSCKSISS